MDELRLPDGFDGLVLSLVSWAIVALIAIVLIAPVVVTGQSGPLPPVYHPSRLQVVQPMVAREGIVATTPVHERDGDLTFDLEDRSHAARYHVEIVCVFYPQFEAAREACSGYTNHVLIPHRGDWIRVTGPLVRDLVHDAQYHELEIHPAVTIDILAH